MTDKASLLDIFAIAGKVGVSLESIEWPRAYHVAGAIFAGCAG